MSEDKTQDTVEEEKVGPGAYIALLAALVFFSGIFYKIDGYKWLGALDFTTLAGAFGQISGKTFVGSGGIGARSGFLFALSLVPTVMLALGILEIVTYYGAIRAARALPSLPTCRVRTRVLLLPRALPIRGRLRKKTWS